MDTEEEVIRLLALQVRLALPSQGEAIRELDRSGFGPSRIAELLGTTANTVSVTLRRAKKKNTVG